MFCIFCLLCFLSFCFVQDCLSGSELVIYSRVFCSNQNIRECIIVGFGLVVWIPGIPYERDRYLPPRMSFCHILPTYTHEV